MLLAGTNIVLSAGSEVELLGQACDGGYAAKCYDLGVIYHNGHIINKDTLKAKELFRKACDGGYARGCAALESKSVTEFSGSQGAENASFAKDCPQQAFKKYAEKLDKGKIESVNNLKDHYGKIASKQSKQCRSLLFGDFRQYYYQMTQAYIFSVENSLNETYPLPPKKEKKYKAELQEVGLLIYQSEGMYYVEADSGWFLREFGDSLPDAWKKFLKQSNNEEKNHFAEDAVLQISFDELRERIIFWENFLNNYPDFPEKSQVEKLLSSYLFFYLSDLYSSLNFAHIQISSGDIGKSYENFTKQNSKSKYYDIVKSQYTLIKDNDYKIDKKTSKRLDDNYNKSASIIKNHTNKMLYPLKKGNKYGLATEAGKWILEPQFDEILVIDEVGGAVDTNGWIRVKNNEKWGVINKEGEWILEPQFDDVGYFQVTDMVAAKYHGKWGLVSAKGEWVLKPQFDEIRRYSENDATGFGVVTLNGKWGLIDDRGEWVLEQKFNDIEILDDQIYVKFGDQEGYTTLDGKYLTFTKDELRNENYNDENSRIYPFVCYEKKIKDDTGKSIYHKCIRSEAQCSSLEKLHFGEYLNDSKAHKAFIRCSEGNPKFIDPQGS